ncbi:purple acid phosphatase family protein [Haloferula chungangensis]|uniref:Purple acid phosphatase family protein n=1 Tax=Haloferula chungangensis TaxID=1048331 RepID=A0ABW2L9C3_9BACT
MLLSSAAHAIEVTRGPYLQLAHERGVTIVWRTDQALKQPKVLFQEAGKDGILTCSGDAILRRSMEGESNLHSAPKGSVQYEAKLDGLKPLTTYRYVLYDGADALTEGGLEFRFRTHPRIGVVTPARIWVVGDSGTGELHQRMVNKAMLSYTENSSRPLDFYLHVGDMAYGQGTDDQFQKKFFEPYEETLRNTVCWGSLGNHEGKTSNGGTGIGPFFDAYVCPTAGEAGGVPSGQESFYSFDYGDIHLICLNSYDIDRSPQGEMAQWLVRDLAATQARWIIGFWHHPPYTKGTHDSDKEVELIEMRKYIMPILEAGGVDLVLCGHSHIYERSMLIDGAYATPTSAEGVILDDRDGDPDGDGPYRKSGVVTPHNGTVAVVTGHGGALGRNAKGISPIMRSIVLDHGSTILDVDGDTLVGTMLDLKGKERDRFSIVKEGVVNHQVMTDPWTPTEKTQERTGAGVLGSPKTIAAAKEARKAGMKNIGKLMPEGSKPIIPAGAVWDYLAGGDGPETEMWTQLGFDAREEEWKSGKAGFGYGDGDDQTVLKDMRNQYSVIFIRREFVIPQGSDPKKLGLLINYDDGFVLHVNGRELLSKGVTRGKGGKVANHEASGADYFPLTEFSDAFRVGKNVIALEGHNVSKSSSDLSLDPVLMIEP